MLPTRPVLSHPSQSPLWERHRHPPTQYGKVGDPGVTPGTSFFMFISRDHTVIHPTLYTLPRPTAGAETVQSSLKTICPFQSLH